MLFGARKRTTSFLVTPRRRRPWESLTVTDFNCAKERDWEESASMRAGLVGKEETLLKRCETRVRFGSFGTTREGLRDLYIPSEPYPDLCFGTYIHQAKS